MRKNRIGREKNGFSMIVLDDDCNITDALSSYFDASGFTVDTSNDPINALEQMKQHSYDILLLDFLMTPICGDEVLARLREFDKRIFVILLTGHKEIAPPLYTIRELDIQGYFEKTDRFDQLELLVESSLKSIRQIRTIERYQDGLTQILSGIPRLHHLLPLTEIAGQIMEQIHQLLDNRNIFVWLKPRNIIRSMPVDVLPENVFCGTGCFDKEFDAFLLEDYEVRTDLFQACLSENKIVFQDNLALLPLPGGSDAWLGVIGLNKQTGLDEVQAYLVSVYVEQISTALHNTILNILLNTNNKALANAISKLKESYMQTVEALRLLVDAKDIYTGGHSDRVSYYSLKLAKALNKSESFCECVRIAGLLHDIGKVGVADSVLCKNKELTDEEYESIRLHPRMGAKILSCIDMFQDLDDIVLSHHERYDGSGYPNQRRGDEIPLQARIISIADAFDAMMSNRHYRKKLTLEKALRELREGKNTQFDGSLVDVFISIIESDFEQMNQELQWTY